MKNRTYRHRPRQDRGGPRPPSHGLAEELRDLARGNAKEAVGAILMVMNDARTAAAPRLAAAGIILDLARDEHEHGADWDGESDFSRVLRAVDEIRAKEKAAAQSEGGDPADGNGRVVVKY